MTPQSARTAPAGMDNSYTTKRYNNIVEDSVGQTGSLLLR